MCLVIPQKYETSLGIIETQQAIKDLKDFFENRLGERLKLTRVSSPLFVLPETGTNDNLNGVEKPVSFQVPYLNKDAEIVHSLAKSGFLLTVFRISAALRNEVTAKKLDGTRNWKVVASSEGRKAEAISPTGFTGLPQPSLVIVSSARSVLRWKR